MLDFKMNWDESFPLYEFAYNNGYHSKIGLAPYESLYKRKVGIPLCWEKIGVRSFHGPLMVVESSEKVRQIRETLKIASSHQNSYACSKRGNLQFQVDDRVFLKVSLVLGTLRFGQKEKLS